VSTISEMCVCATGLSAEFYQYRDSYSSLYRVPACDPAMISVVSGHEAVFSLVAAGLGNASLLWRRLT
jgi:hypothetical protein